MIEKDFLKYAGSYAFDLIVMNPPFSNGDEHLLKAWQILEHGNIVCLLNRETIDNLFSQKRQLLHQIIAENGSVEYLANCFATAERTSNVEVAMVRLEKKGKANKFDFFGNLVAERIIF